MASSSRIQRFERRIAPYAPGPPGSRDGDSGSEDAGLNKLASDCVVLQSVFLQSYSQQPKGWVCICKGPGGGGGICRPGALGTERRHGTERNLTILVFAGCWEHSWVNSFFISEHKSVGEPPADCDAHLRGLTQSIGLFVVPCPKQSHTRTQTL